MRVWGGFLLWLAAVWLLLRRITHRKRWERPPVWELGTLVLLAVLPYGCLVTWRFFQSPKARLTAMAVWAAAGALLAVWLCRRYLLWRRESRRKDERMENLRGFPAMERALDFCRAHHMLPPPGGVMLCAVSGGRDSMALLHFLKTVSRREGFALHAAHYNHHLRPTADRDENLVRQYCRQREIPLTCGGGDVAAWARQQGASLEDAARTLRYRFLEETADAVGAERIATAHHVQDNAETVLLHLLRGSGLRGLGGIPPVRGRIVRPFLETDRRDIDAYVAREEIPYTEDETNADTAYTRNRLRWEILPLLEEASPGCTGRIAAAAGLLREEEAHLTAECKALLPSETGDVIRLPATLLGQQDAAMRRRLVREGARRLGGELTAQQTQAVLELGSGGSLDLPGGLQAFRQSHRLTLRRLPPPPEPLALRRGEQVWNGGVVRVEETAQWEHLPPGCALAAEKVSGPLTIAPWDGTGRLTVENGSRTVKRLFADRKIPAHRRGEHPALYDGAGRLLAVLGVAADWEFRPRPGERAMTVVWEREERSHELL